jgi:hypothetical protein
MAEKGVVMLRVIYSECHKKPFMLGVVMLNVVMPLLVPILSKLM